jgi:hypothetical protein
MSFVDLLLSFTKEFYKIQFKPFLKKGDWTNCMSTTKAFTDLKRTTRRIRGILHKEDTRRFFRDFAFRNWFVNLISDAKSELGLWFDGTYFSASENQALDLAPFSSVVRLDIADFPRIRNLTMLSNLRTLYIRNCPTTLDMELLTTIAKIRLELKRCSNLVNFENIHPIKVLELRFINSEHFKGCERASLLVLESCNIKQFNGCGNIEDLHLKSCSLIEDVSMFKNTNYVHLEMCQSIEDIDQLTGNKSLIIEYCNSITSINQKLVTKCEKYSIKSTVNLSISIEGEIADLTISGLRVTRVAINGIAEKLFLDACYAINDFSGIANAVVHLETLKSQLTELSHFSRLKTYVKHYGYENMKKITNLPELEEITLDESKDLVLLENLPKCKKISPKCPDTTVIR